MVQPAKRGHLLWRKGVQTRMPVDQEQRQLRRIISIARLVGASATPFSARYRPRERLQSGRANASCRPVADLQDGKLPVTSSGCRTDILASNAWDKPTAFPQP